MTTPTIISIRVCYYYYSIKFKIYQQKDTVKNVGKSVQKVEIEYLIFKNQMKNELAITYV